MIRRPACMTERSLTVKSEIELLLVGNITWPEKWGGSRKSFCHSSGSFTLIERNWKSFHFIDYRSLKAKTLDNIWESCEELITEKFAFPLFPLHNTSRATRDLWTSRDLIQQPDGVMRCRWYTLDRVPAVPNESRQVAENSFRRRKSS